MNYIYRLAFLLPFYLLVTNHSYAEESNKVITNEIKVVDKKEKIKTGIEISKDDMDRTNAQNLWEALRYSNGITMLNGDSKGFSSFSIRGFSSRTIPLIINDIPITNPFNGYGDISSILTDDTETITIQKGYSSMLYGANGMGGAIILNTSKPKEVFEGKIKTTFEMDNNFKTSAVSPYIYLGSKTSKFYIKSSLQYKSIDHFNLSNKYTPMQGSLQQKGERLFSDESNIQSSTIIGSDYIDGLDIWAEYTYTDTNKGLNIPEATSNYDITEWDYYIRHSISLHTKYNKNNLLIDALLYFDKYNNQFNRYASLIHYNHKKPYAVSKYDEYALGFNFKSEYKFLENHFFRTALSIREDDHKDYYNNQDNLFIKENKLSLGIEYATNILNNLHFAVSTGFDSLIPVGYESRNNEYATILGLSEYQIKQKNRWLLAAQLGIFYDIADNNQLRLTYARRNQFPTMNDRYSTSFSEILPNPNLKPEVADHVELGYKGLLFNMLYVDTDLYYSYVSNKMGIINVPDPFSPYHSVEFITNLDKVSLYGFELALTFFPWEYTELGFNLAVNKHFIHETVSSYNELTYLPELLLNSYIKITPCPYISITPVVEYVSKRYIDLSGINYLEPYFLFNLYVQFNINDNMKIEFNALNILDENYSMHYGFPSSGRSYSLMYSYEF